MIFAPSRKRPCPFGFEVTWASCAEEPAAGQGLGLPALGIGRKVLVRHRRDQGLE